MDHSLHTTLRKIFGDERIEEAYRHMASIPVSFAALRNYCIHARIEELILENKSDAYIARKVPRCPKTISRKRAALSGKPKKNSPPKK